MKKNIKTMAAIVLAIMALASCQSKKELGLQVLTQQGLIEGLADEQGELKMYLGVPFAAAPVGDLRWRAPQPVAPWEGVREAKDFGPDPMQHNVFGDMNFRGNGRSEDCLYLNIWTPAKYQNEGLPVLIYFNGGGLVAGSGSEPRYDGAALARKGVVTITANYREGVFGFMAHPELTAETDYHGSGNYGFLDQAAAIRWAKDNIAAFGGDPSRITIVGESAGSFSVSVLMCSPLSKGNLAGAMLSSGAYAIPMHALTQEEADERGLQIFERAGIASLEEARALPSDELLDRMPGMNMGGLVVDHYFLTEDVCETLAKGEQAQVPLLAGWNSQEGSPEGYLRGNEPTIGNFRAAMTHTFGEMTDEILTAYGITTDADVLSQRANDLCGDLFTGFGTWYFSHEHARLQPVYRYKYNHARPNPSAKMEGYTAALAGGVKKMTEEEKKAEEARPHFTKGAVHSADIEYAMGNLATNEFYDWSDDDYAISELFLTFYANFCKTGNPNGEGLPEWDSMQGADVAPVMQIDVESKQLCSEDVENAYQTMLRFYRK